MRVNDVSCKRYPEVCGTLSCRQEKNPKVCQMPDGHLGEHFKDPSSCNAVERKQMSKKDCVTRAEFDAACDALWTELSYQDSLPRRTDDEAKSIPAFLTLLNRYMRKVEDSWADNPGVAQSDGQVQVDEALHGLRKVTAIGLRAMVYNGIRSRGLSKDANGKTVVRDSTGEVIGRQG